MILPCDCIELFHKWQLIAGSCSLTQTDFNSWLRRKNGEGS